MSSPASSRERATGTLRAGQIRRPPHDPAFARTRPRASQRAAILRACAARHRLPTLADKIPMKQRTLSRPVTIKGNALHTGDAVTLTIKPAAADHGVVFKRTDLSGSPG